MRPSRDQPLVTAENLQVAPHLRDLYAYLLRNRSIESIRGYREEYLPIFSRDVLAKLRAAQAGWEKMVPPPVAHMIKRRKLLGFRDTRTQANKFEKESRDLCRSLVDARVLPGSGNKQIYGCQSSRTHRYLCRRREQR